MQKQNTAKKNIRHKKCKCLKMNLLTKCSHNNDEMHILNNIVAQKRQQQRPCCCMQTQLYLLNLFNDKMSSFYTLLSQAADKPLLMNLIENAYSVTVAMLLTSQNTVSVMQLACQKFITQKSAEPKTVINEHLSALHYTLHFSSAVASSHTLCSDFIFTSALRDVITS